MDRSNHSTRRRLRDEAVTSVTSAISRGRKRRSDRRNVATDDIQIGPSTDATAEQLAVRGAPRVAKRPRTSVIPGHNSDAEDDSNDEWEEHVDLDSDKVAAAVASLEVEKKGKEKTSEKKPTAVDAAPTEVEVPDPAELAKEREARERRRAAKARKSALRRHRLHLLLSVAHLQRLDTAAADENVRGFALSIMPEDTFLDKDAFAESLSRFGLWLRATFRLTAMRQVRRKQKLVGGRTLCSAAERAALCAQRGGGDVMDMLTVVAALVRDQGFRCRIVSALQPVPHLPPKKGRETHKVTGRVKIIDVQAADSFEAVLYGWVEILSSESKWTPLDLCGGHVGGDEPMRVISESFSRIQIFDATEEASASVMPRPSASTPSRRSLRQKNAPPKEELPPRKVSPNLFCHVVAIENGICTDVTRRYARNWKDVERSRAARGVFQRVLETLQGKDIDEIKDDAYKNEVAEFEALAADEALPTSISAFQRSPRYILERHLKKYEFIHPRWPVVGHFKNEPIFLRSNVCLLHTRDRWIRRMRVVVEDAEPLKLVRSMNGTDATVDLFGEWQTEPLVIPECVNGVVPKGTRGNIDLWSPEHLPKGTVHVNLPYAKIAARQLGVDFAPAMTGFEIRGGRSVPKLEGVVVATGNGDLVRDAARAAAHAAMERQEKKARTEACGRWLKLLRTVSAREKVRKKYGGMFEDTGTYEAIQKREGLRRAQEEKYGRRESKAEAVPKSPSAMRKAIASKDQSHEHVYGEARCLKGDVWVKSCDVCGLEVSFERL